MYKQYLFASENHNLTDMATKEVPTLLPEIIQKIALFLPLSDVGKCMQVCKQWKVSILAIIMIIRMKMIVIKLMIIIMIIILNNGNGNGNDTIC